MCWGAGLATETLRVRPLPALTTIWKSLTICGSVESTSPKESHRTQSLGCFLLTLAIRKAHRMAFNQNCAHWDCLGTSGYLLNTFADRLASDLRCCKD
jgi:hypothetical protein